MAAAGLMAAETAKMAAAGAHTMAANGEGTRRGNTEVDVGMAELGMKS